MEDVGAAMVMGGIGEVTQDTPDLGTGGACTAPVTGVTASMDPDGGGPDRTGVRIGEEDIILITLIPIMEAIPIPAMDT